MHSSSSYHAFVIDLRGGDDKPILPKVSDINNTNNNSSRLL